MKLKKLFVITTVMFALLIFCSISVNAYRIAGGTCGDSVTWELNDAGKLTISGSGKMSDFSSSDIPWNAYTSQITTVNIKSSVTTIGGYSFYGCDGLTEVTLNDGITTIGGNAFESCTSLANIEIPDSVTSIGDGAFKKLYKPCRDKHTGKCGYYRKSSL